MSNPRGRIIEYGAVCIAFIGTFELWGHLDLDEEQLVRFLHLDAQRILPPHTRYQIRKGRTRSLTDAMSWYRDADMDHAHTWGRSNPRSPALIAVDGYRLVGEFTTPTRSFVSSNTPSSHVMPDVFLPPDPPLPAA